MQGFGFKRSEVSEVGDVVTVVRDGGDAGEQV